MDKQAQEIRDLSAKEQYRLACRYHRCGRRGNFRGMNEYGGRQAIYYIQWPVSQAASKLYEDDVAKSRDWDR